jgi:hypothetical protein
MTEQLKEAVDLAIQKLPDTEQNMIARYILHLLDAYEEENEGHQIEWVWIGSHEDYNNL